MAKVSVPFSALLEGLEEKHIGGITAFGIGLRPEQEVNVSHSIYNPPAELVIRVGSKGMDFAQYLKELLDAVRGEESVRFDGDYLYREGLSMMLYLTSLASNRFNNQKAISALEENVPKGLDGILTIGRDRKYDISYRRSPIYRDNSTFTIKPIKEEQLV